MTHDSFYLNAKQNWFFTFFSVLIFLCLFLAAWVSLYALLALIGFAILVRNPIFVEVYIQRGLGPNYEFHWSLPLGLFTLFCVNFRLFGLRNDLAKDVKLKLETFRDLHHD